LTASLGERFTERGDGLGRSLLHLLGVRLAQRDHPIFDEDAPQLARLMLGGGNTSLERRAQLTLPGHRFGLAEYAHHGQVSAAWTAPPRVGYS
jgi:hypothetical protein